MSEIRKAEAVYTGGNIWLFHGQLSDGNWFLTDDYGCVLILDTNPDNDWENCCYEDWQKAHLIKELVDKERTDFTDALADFMLTTETDVGPITDEEIKYYKKYWREEW